jgi:hypothetical protein
MNIRHRATYTASDIAAKERELQSWDQKRRAAGQKLNEAQLSYNNLDTIVVRLMRQLDAMKKDYTS